HGRLAIDDRSVGRFPRLEIHAEQLEVTNMRLVNAPLDGVQWCRGHEQACLRNNWGGILRPQQVPLPAVRANAPSTPTNGVEGEAPREGQRCHGAVGWERPLARETGRGVSHGRIVANAAPGWQPGNSGTPGAVAPVDWKDASRERIDRPAAQPARAPRRPD